MRALKVVAALTLTLALTGCASSLFGGGGRSTLGDGKLDLVKLVGLVTSVQSGNYNLVCETVLASQPKASATERGLLQAACLGLLGDAASPAPAPQLVVASAVPAGDACGSLEVACKVAQDACGWQ